MQTLGHCICMLIQNCMNIDNTKINYKKQEEKIIIRYYCVCDQKQGMTARVVHSLPGLAEPEIAGNPHTYTNLSFTRGNLRK
ncbi:hypothetical protein PRUPE_1G420600 [Prunus persica]|uniref:Uncharacterized protein n=1 Tax=Prunus persica TaxID=3760 RepID=M5Y0C5_PRUPE|nr:hypothetical protein PRUPE_1G420600 [Prunus persica]